VCPLKTQSNEQIDQNFYVVDYVQFLSYDGVYHMRLIKYLKMKKEYVLVNTLQLPAEVINQMEEAILT
jgi:hypothetical protein